MSHIQIIKINTSHLDTLQEISRKIFLDSFYHLNNPDDILDYVDRAFSGDQLTKELRDPNSEFYFAIEGDQAIGYLKVNEGVAQTELQHEHGLEIERIYVDVAHQGKKVGQALLDFAVQIARDRKLDFVWLGVWEMNPKAIKFYERNGFVRFGQHTFMIGTDPQTDYLMKLTLGKGKKFELK